MKGYELLRQFHYRVPLLSVDAIVTLLAEIEKKGAAPAMRAFFASPLTQEALFIGSGSLYNRFLEWTTQGIKNPQKEEKLLLALLKYALRMAGRCTPFGLFAGIGTGEWAAATHHFVLADKERVHKHVSLDADYVYNIKLAIAGQYPEIKSSLRYYSNSTFCRTGNTYRYITYGFTSDKRIYRLQTVGWSAYLEKIIQACRNGRQSEDIVQLLMTFDVSEAEARAFLRQLIEHQLLVSELEPRLGDGDSFEQLYNSFVRDSRWQDFHVLKPLQTELARIRQTLDFLNANPASSDYTLEYNRLLLQHIQPKLPVQQHFLVNSTRPAIAASLDARLAGSLRKALSVLNKLSLKPAESALPEFRERFRQRYENRPVRLMEALDAETGIASVYNQIARDETPLLRGFNFEGHSTGNNHGATSVSKGHGILLKKLALRQYSPADAMHLEEEDLAGLTENWEDAPDTLQANFSLVHADGADRIWFLNSPHASALNMINRFTHLDAGTEQIARALAKCEADGRKGSLVAELMYMPSYPRKINVLQHLSVRTCEVPFLGLASENCPQTIFLDDLYLALVNDRLVLYSAEHGQEVQIMLSTALRYSVDTHPVCHFLWDLQYQNKVIPGKFDWGPLRQWYSFLPRVYYKDILLSPATWHFETKNLLPAHSQHEVAAVRAFQQAHQIPDRVELVDGDNILLLDFTQDFCVQLFCQHCRKSSEVTLREFLPPAKGWPVLDEQGAAHRSEMIAFFLRKEIPDDASPLKLSAIVPWQSGRLDVFSDWLYAKLYCGTQGGEEVLTEQILPLARQLLKDGLIRKWFFIRYHDEGGFHIRVRFHLYRREDKNTLLEALHQALEGSMQKQILHNVVLDTYQRERTRYGEANIELTEELFFADSMAVLSALEILRATGDENRRSSFMIWSADNLLNSFGLENEEKIALLKKLTAAHAPHLRPQINVQYNRLKPDVPTIFSQTADEKVIGAALMKVEAQKSESLHTLIPRLSFADVSRHAYISSSLHMMINRICLSQPNRHEKVVYEYLLKYYNSLKIKR